MVRQLRITARLERLETKTRDLQQRAEAWVERRVAAAMAAVGDSDLEAFSRGEGLDSLRRYLARQLDAIEDELATELREGRLSPTLWACQWNLLLAAFGWLTPA